MHDRDSFDIDEVGAAPQTAPQKCACEKDDAEDMVDDSQETEQEEEGEEMDMFNEEDEGVENQNPNTGRPHRSKSGLDNDEGLSESIHYD